MTVALGQVSHNIYDAAGALLQNKQIETQKAIALAQIRAANGRAALGAAQSALGALNSNAERAKDRQAIQQRDAQQRQEQQRQQRASRLQQILAEINKENSKWDQHREQMRQRGFQHSMEQEGDLFAIDQEHNKLARKLNEEIKAGNMPAAETIALEMLGTLQNRWIYQPKTAIPPKFEEIEGQKFIRDANGNLKEIGNLQEKIRNDNQAHADRVAANKLRVTQEARDAFNDAYQTGGTFNEALDAKNEILTSNGLPPSPMARKSASDPGYYFNDPKAAIAEQKKLDADEKYLRGRRDKIMDGLRKTPDEEWKPGQRQKEFEKIWKEEGYQALERRLESQRGGQSQHSGGQVSESEIPQDVTEAKGFLDKIAQLKSSGWRSPDPQQLLKDVQAAKGVLSAYEIQNPGRLSSLPAAPSRASQTQQAPVGPGQGQGVPQQAPQTAQPPVQAPASGPFKNGNFLNGPRAPQTSSLGGGGLGGLAMMGDPLSGLYERGEPSQDPRDNALATAPDASGTASGDVEDQVGFIEKMKAWLERNPQPSSSYMGVKGTTNPNQSAYPIYQKGGRVYGGDLPSGGLTPEQYRLQKTLSDVQGRSQSGYQSAGSVIPGFSGGGNAPQMAPVRQAGTALVPYNEVQALKQLDDWERANAGNDVSAIRKAITERYGPGLSPGSSSAPFEPLSSRLSAEELQVYKKLNPEVAKTADAMSKSGVSPSTSLEAAQQLGKVSQSVGGKALSGLGSISRSLGGLGNVLTMLGWVGSQLQETKQFLDEQFRDWAVARMAAENNQADQFGIPRSEARRLSNSIDKYTKGVDQGHLSQMRSRADKMVPPVSQSQTQSTAPSEVAKSRPQTPQMTVSPFAFVNENTLRQKIWDEYEKLWDKLPARFVTDKEQQGLRDQQSELEAKAKAAETDRTNYPWQKYLGDVSQLAESWARAKGYEGGKTQAHTDLMKFSETVPDIGNWDRPQPDFTKPNGLNSWEWKKLSSDIGKPENQSFFGPHIDKQGSYTRRDGEQRYNPDASRQQSNQNQIQVSRDSGGNAQLTNGAGQTKRLESLEGRPLFPDSESGPSSEGRASTLSREAQARQDERDTLESQAVTFLGLSGNGQHPTEDGKNASEAVNFTARTKTTQLNDTMQQLDAKGELPPSLLEFPDKFPSWVTRLPAATWRDKQGVEHHRNDVPTDEEGLQNLVNEISKSKGIGKYSPEAKSAEKAGQEGEQPAAEGDPNADQAPPSASVLSPEMQEHHLRTPKPPTKEAFEKGLRDNGFQPQPGEYDDYLKARQAVRSAPQVTGGKDGTAPGNLFLDKDGTLKQSDGKSGKPVPKDQPLPPGYKNLVPQPNEQPFQGQPQGQRAAPNPQDAEAMRDVERNAAAGRAIQANRIMQRGMAPFVGKPGVQFDNQPRLQQKLNPQQRKQLEELKANLLNEQNVREQMQQQRMLKANPNAASLPPQDQPNRFNYDNALTLNSLGNDPIRNDQFAREPLGYSPVPLGSEYGGGFYGSSQQPQFQPQYDSFPQPSYGSPPLQYYNQPPSEQSYFAPQFDSFNFQPQYDPVGPAFEPAYQSNIGSLGYTYGDYGGYYGGNIGDGAYDYSEFA